MEAELLFEQAQPAEPDLVFGSGAGAPLGPNDLVFAKHQPASSHLVFGALEEGSTVPGVDLAIGAEFAALTLRAELAPRADVSAAAWFEPLAVSVQTEYRSNTQRPTVGKHSAAWALAYLRQDAVGFAHQGARKAPQGWQAHWQRASVQNQVLRHFLPDLLIAAPVTQASSFEEAVSLGAVARFASQEANRGQRHLLAGRYERARQECRRTFFRHQDADRTKRARQCAAHQNALRLGSPPYPDRFTAAHALHVGRLGWFQEAVVPPPGSSIFNWPEPPARTPCYTPSAELVFELPIGSSAHLVFICESQAPLEPPGESVVVPIRRVYFVINDVSLHRVSDGTQVPVFSLSLSLDAASWAWGFEATLPASAESLVDSGNGSGPVELLASINGTTFRLLAESISRERSFGDASIKVSGRGRNAVLAAPYAPVMNFSNAEARTARQLMDDVLTVNGVPLGWSVDWGLTDWNVPAGVFSHQGTWIEALSAIAAAAGGYLIPHRTDKSIGVRHLCPIAPWEWNTVTPDFCLPVDAVSREHLSWLDKPAYNRVFVSGQEAGVLGQVTRAGTAGDVLAPMVVDSLITEAVAARQRGIAVLSDTGRQIEVSLRLPVLAETGIIEPGAFVEYQDGSVSRIGLVRATQVQAGLPEVWQTLGVQTYA